MPDRYPVKSTDPVFPGESPSPYIEVNEGSSDMKWPRGKYNGRRIVGISVKVQIDITDWDW